MRTTGRRIALQRRRQARRRALLASGSAVLLVAAGIVLGTTTSLSDQDQQPPAAISAAGRNTENLADTDESGAPEPTSRETRMVPLARITGDISPKSVVASSDGIVMANNS
ncbi:MULTISPECIES: hypothetical protein [unclassified Brachybacterium]|uniref:hypothetical protein n=1 Tax=unclassified Brachybacterium TaxID=2623841 RepID=UPI0011AF3AB0|nr:MULTISPECIES: hypothetical protein [unclassified Brachybacterium]